MAPWSQQSLVIIKLPLSGWSIGPILGCCVNRGPDPHALSSTEIRMLALTLMPLRPQSLVEHTALGNFISSNIFLERHARVNPAGRGSISGRAWY